MAPAGGQYKTLGGDPLKIGPPNGLSLQDVFERDRLRSTRQDALNSLFALLCSGLSAMRQVKSNGEEAWWPLGARFWKDCAYPWLEIGFDGVDCVQVHCSDATLIVHCPGYSLLDAPAEFFVWGIEREDPTTAALPLSPGKEPTTAPPKSPTPRKKPESKPRRSETAPKRFNAYAAAYKESLNGANPAMDRFIVFARNKYGIKGHRPDLWVAYKELFPDQKQGRPPKNNPPKINPPK